MSIFSKKNFLKRPAAIDIRRDFYTMASVDGDSAEITMYGDIVESQPVDWWSGEPIEGSFIIQSEFLEDLKAVSGCKKLTIRMNSLGGDAGVSIFIHNRLRELAAAGMELTCIVDGVAMSGGSLIMCACDTVRVNPSSLVMIHKCWMFLFGGYNADEMRQVADSADAWDKAQVAIYKRKCSLSETVITHMLANTTYMTGREAVEKGFADEVMENADALDIAASADGRALFVRGRKLHLTPGMSLPDTIPTVKPGASAAVETNTNQPANPGSKNGGKTMAQNLEELRKENPELAEQLMTEARAAVVTPAAPAPATSAVQTEDPEVVDPVVAERQRIQDIDAVAALFDDETVQEAKYGAKPCTAQEMAYRAAQKAVKQGSKFLSNLETDNKVSGAQAVGAAPGTANEEVDEATLPPDQRLANARMGVKALLDRKKKEEE